MTAGSLNVSATTHTGGMTQGDALSAAATSRALWHTNSPRSPTQSPRWNEDALLPSAESDICEELEQEFLVEPLVLDRDGTTADPVKEDVAVVHQYGEAVRFRQTVVAISVPFTGNARTGTALIPRMKSNSVSSRGR